MNSDTAETATSVGWRSTVKRTFIGECGLRAGWRFLLFNCLSKRDKANDILSAGALDMRFFSIVHTVLSSAVLNLESDTCSVNRSLAHGHEFHTLQLANRDTITIYGNPARSVPGETLIVAGNNDPSVQPILTKFHPHPIHTMHRALGRSPLARCALLCPPPRC